MSQTPEKVSAFDLANLKIIQYKELSVVESTQEEVILTVKDLIDKIADYDENVAEILSYFPEETPFVRLFWLENAVQISIPQIYKSEEGKINLYDVAKIPSPIEMPIKWLKYVLEWHRDQDPKKTIVTGKQVFAINVENDNETQYLICPVGLSSQYIKSIQEEQNQLTDADIPKGQGLVDAQYLRYYPRPLTPMALVEVNEVYYVKDVILQDDPRYPNSSRYLLGKLNGDEEISEHEVLANHSIRKHYQQFGQKPFTILSKKEKDKKFAVKVGLRSLAVVR